MVTDRMAEGQDAFETVKDNLTEHLKNQKLLLALDQLVESLKKEVKIEYVNKDYDPEEIQKAVQKSIQESTEAAKEIREADKK
jgi:hypothetical protein